MGSKRKNILILFNCFMILNIILNIFAIPCFSTVKVQAIPSENIPNEIIIENDSLYIHISLDWKLSITSFKYKPRDVEFIQPGYPMPLVGIENNWSLYNCGFGIRNAKITKTKEKVDVLIHAFSNYLENPFHLFIKLTVRELSQIEAKIWLENRLIKGFHDLYRETDDLVPTGVVPGLPWLPFLSPIPGGERRVLYPAQSGYVLTKVTERMMDKYHPVYEWERPSDPGLVRMMFNGARAEPSDPMIPTIVEFPAIDLGVFLYREKSDIKWRFNSIEEAMWPSQSMGINRGGRINIFEGVLRVFEGDWHKGFYWFKNRFRSRFDFTNYMRPGNEKFKNMFLGCWSFIYNHNIYNPVKNQFTIGEYLKKVKYEFGGFDQFVFWHSYNRVGVDPRDQFDLLQDLPGGIDGVKRFVNTAHAMGTKVYLPFNPWDKIRKRKNMYRRQAEDLGTVGADGLFLDTMGGGDQSFRKEVNKYNPSAQFLSEFRPSFKGLQFTTSHYNENFQIWPMNTVDLLRFVLPEHKIYKTERLQRDRKYLIYNAFFNATGYAVWDDVFGEINVQTWDEKILIKRYNETMHNFAYVFEGDRSMPLVPSLKKDLYINGFFNDEIYIYTLLVPERKNISRWLDTRIIGRIFQINIPDNWHLVDVWNIRPVEVRIEKNKKYVFLPQEMPDVAGCIAAMPKLIDVTKKNGIWTAKITGDLAGTLELIGFDGSTLQDKKIFEVKSSDSLTFNRDSVKKSKSTDGYVMIQYRNDNKEVKDVALVKVGY